MKSVPVIGFLILAIMAASVFGFATYQAWTSQAVVGIVLTVLLLGFLYTIYNESKGLSKAKADNLFGQKNLINMACVIAGGLVAYALNYQLKLGSVIAASAVGLVAGFLIKDYAAPLYVGSLIGMASKAVLPGYLQVLVAGVIAGLIYVFALAVFGGFGGKFGTIAVSGVVVTGLILGGKFSQPAVPAWTLGWKLIATSLVAAVAAFYINNNLKQGPVLGSAIVGMAAGLLGKVIPGTEPAALATMAICGSFLGMSNTKRFPSIVPLGIAGLVLGVVHMFASPFLGGAGGKLGCMAFGSGMAVRGCMDLLATLGIGKKS